MKQWQSIETMYDAIVNNYIETFHISQIVKKV